MSSPALGSPAYNNESIGWQLITTDLVTISIAFVLVIARLYTKFFLTKSPGWEDCHSVIALLLAVGRVVGDSFGVYRYSLGRHFSVFPKSDMGPLMALLVADGLLYVVSITFAKLAILIFLYRIFKVVPKFRYTSWAIGAFMTIWALVTVLLVCFSCKPIAGAFNFQVRMRPTTVCRISASRAENIFGFCNILVDFVLLFLPMPFLWKLQMTRAKKIGVSIIFANGAVICAIAIVRQYILYSATDGTDPAWDIIKVKVWMTIEVNLAITCGCLPVLQPLVRNSLLAIPFLPSLIRSKLTGSQSTTDQASSSRRLADPGSANAQDVEHGRKTPWRQPDELSESGDRLAPAAVGTEGWWSELKGVAL